MAKVEDVFRITGRGFVVVPGPMTDGIRVRAKDPIQLLSSDGRQVDTHIAAAEFLCGPKVKNHVAFLLPSDVTEKEAFCGAEIWLSRD